MIEDGILVGKDDKSSLSQAPVSCGGPPTLPRPIQGRTGPHRYRTGRAHCYHGGG
jgi:hypothetical protein